MKKIIILIVNAVLILVLCSCNTKSNYTVTFYDGERGAVIETQVVQGGNLVHPVEIANDVRWKSKLIWCDMSGNIFDFTTPIERDLALQSMWKSILPYPNHDQIDYVALGFLNGFNEPKSELFTMWNRVDGTINPYSEITVEVIDPNYEKIIDFETPTNPNITEKIDPLYTLFNAEIYTHYRRFAIAPNAGWFYVDTLLNENDYKLRFFEDGSDTEYFHRSSRPYPYIDAIESNGSYSYIINYTYVTNAFDDPIIKDGMYNLFYVIYHDADFPYIVFFTKEFIFLISKNDSFDKQFFDVFSQYENIKLFKA